MNALEGPKRDGGKVVLIQIPVGWHTLAFSRFSRLPTFCRCPSRLAALPARWKRGSDEPTHSLPSSQTGTSDHTFARVLHVLRPTSGQICPRQPLHSPTKRCYALPSRRAPWQYRKAPRSPSPCCIQPVHAIQSHLPSQCAVQRPHDHILPSDFRAALPCIC